jgi:hypothetical protein
MDNEPMEVTGFARPGRVKAADPLKIVSKSVGSKKRTGAEFSPRLFEKGKN